MSKRRSRNNTAQEKKDMKRARRKKKMAMKRSNLEVSLKNEEQKRISAEKEVLKYKSMCRCYWERWQWELVQRKEKLKKTNEHVPVVSRIDVSLLKNPEVEGSKDSDAGVYVGRRSFGIVRIQTFRGINVAVKEFLPHTQAGDVKHGPLTDTENCL